MWTTISLYVALVLIAVVLYYLTRSTARTGGAQNFWDWLKKGANGRGLGSAANPVLSPRQGLPSSGDEVDVVTVLEDLYREFKEESQRIRDELEMSITKIHREYEREFEELHQEVMQLRRDLQEKEMAVLSNYVMDPRVEENPVPSTGVDTPNKPSEATYFRILDELQQGKVPQTIALSLGVELEEVHRVIQFMSSP